MINPIDINQKIEEELRTPNTVLHIADMIAALGPMDREQLLKAILPQLMCMSCGSERKSGERTCQCWNDE